MDTSAAASGPVTGYLYDARGHDRTVTVDAAVLAGLHDQALLWIDVPGRSRPLLDHLAQLLDLDPASVAALAAGKPPAGLTTHAAPSRLDNYGRYVQFSLPVAPHDVDAPGPPDGARLDFIVARGWLVTVRDGDVRFLEAFRAQDKAETDIGTLSAPALAASLLDWRLGAFFAEVARIEQVIDHLDERVLADPSAERLLGRILTVRRGVSRLRRQLTAHRPVFYGLGRPDQALLAQDAAAPQLQALAARFDRAVDEVEHARQLVVGSFELFTSRSSQQTNDLVKALTFFTVIIGSAAAIAGLFGMNFDPPFFRSGSRGFFAVTLGMAVVGGAAWIIGRRKRWI